MTRATLASLSHYSVFWKLANIYGDESLQTEETKVEKKAEEIPVNPERDPRMNAADVTNVEPEEGKMTLSEDIEKPQSTLTLPSPVIE